MSCADQRPYRVAVGYTTLIADDLRAAKLTRAAEILDLVTNAYRANREDPEFLFRLTFAWRVIGYRLSST